MELSVVEQRYRAVLRVDAEGASVTEVAVQCGVSRQTVHTWLARYRAEGLAGLVDRSTRPATSPQRVSQAVEATICDLRRAHPRWGPRRLLHELGRIGVRPLPSRMTVYRVLVRHNLIEPTSRRGHRRGYRRWERDAPMALWQLDIVGGVVLTDDTECKIVTGVDDHSRFCVIAAVVPRATGRAVCLAFADALRRFGIPEEVLTDNGKQFTARFGHSHGGEVLFDRICRDNGIAHRLTQPASPTTTGKIERFHQTLRRELLDDHPPFASVLAAQAAVETWVAEYNCTRPHQSLDDTYPVDRFAVGRQRFDDERRLLPLRLPPTLSTVEDTPTEQATPAKRSPSVTGPVEIDRIVPSGGNLAFVRKQFWLGPQRAGMTVTFRADLRTVDLSIAGEKLRSYRSHLSVNDLAALATDSRARLPGQPGQPREQRNDHDEPIEEGTEKETEVCAPDVIASEAN